jgi:hypothetical protein
MFLGRTRSTIATIIERFRLVPSNLATKSAVMTATAIAVAVTFGAAPTIALG